MRGFHIGEKSIYGYAEGEEEEVEERRNCRD